MQPSKKLFLRHRRKKKRVSNQNRQDAKQQQRKELSVLVPLNPEAIIVGNTAVEVFYILIFFRAKESERYETIENYFISLQV
jgi:hypothetical protein